METKKHTEHLKYEFTKKELAEIAQGLARENQEVETIERDKAQVNSAFKSRLTIAQANISRMSSNIREGYDYRSVECEVSFHTPENGFKQICRTDTGEILRTLKMEDYELQEMLPLEEVPVQANV